MTPPSWNVHFFEAFDEERDVIEKTLPEGLTAGFSRETLQESGFKAPPSTILSIRTQSRVPHDWLPSLNGVLSRSTGFDHLASLASDSPSGPAFGHLAEYCSRAVAEHAILMAGSLLRRLPRQCRQMASFLRSGLTGQEMRGRSLTVVGVGRIGSEVARIGQALNMKVLGCDPQPQFDGIPYAPLEDALSRADVLICTMSLNDANRDLLDRGQLSHLPRGAIVVNVARGELMVLEDLLALYDEGHLGGLGLDVFPHEDLLATHLRHTGTDDHPHLSLFRELIQRDNVILTPHNAFNTEESLHMKVQETLSELEHFRKHGQFCTAVPSTSDIIPS